MDTWVNPKRNPSYAGGMKMKENISNRPGEEETLQEALIEEHAAPSQAEELKPDANVDTRPLPKGMRERVETVEISTFTPKG